METHSLAVLSDGHRVCKAWGRRRCLEREPWPGRRGGHLRSARTATQLLISLPHLCTCLRVSPAAEHHARTNSSALRLPTDWGLKWAPSAAAFFAFLAHISSLGARRPRVKSRNAPTTGIVGRASEKETPKVISSKNYFLNNCNLKVTIVFTKK